MVGGDPTPKERSKFLYLFNNNRFSNLFKERRILLDKQKFFELIRAEKRLGRPYRFTNDEKGTILKQIRENPDFNKLLNQGVPIIGQMGQVDRDLNLQLDRFVDFYNKNKDYENSGPRQIYNNINTNKNNLLQMIKENAQSIINQRKH